jgi:hypothetical protein
MPAKHIFSALALFATAYAHIKMAEPAPFGAPDTSPLQASGSDFPCKSSETNGYKVLNNTQMQVGQQQSISFSGTAVHNGGSCQLSLTKDMAPTASSQFKVIYSIMGGCPGLDGATTTYQFKVPSEVPNGEYVFSWVSL